MLRSFFAGLKSHRTRPASGRPASRSRRPLLEAMEDRRLLSTTPYMLINSTSSAEGTGDGGVMTFTVSLTSASTRTISVDYRTVDVAARAGSDYVATSGVLSFAPGQTSKTISVPIVPDSIPETNETLYMRLSGATNAVIYKNTGVGTILDDDAAVAPELSVNDVAMKRGLDGHRYMVFTVSLNTTNFNSPITVRASTRALTARAGVDYESATRTLTFNPGESTKEFAVKIFGTSAPTSNKYFYVDLANTSAGLKRPTGFGIVQFGA